MNINDIKSRRVIRLHEYWCALKGARRMPARADIDPAEIKPLLPNLILAKVETRPFRVRYHLVGTEIARATGYDFTDRYLDELGFDSGTDYWLEQYRSCCQARAPVFGLGRLHYQGHWIRDYEWAVLPLSANGTDVDIVLAIEDYDALVRNATKPS